MIQYDVQEASYTSKAAQQGDVRKPAACVAEAAALNRCRLRVVRGLPPIIWWSSASSGTPAHACASPCRSTPQLMCVRTRE